MHFVILSSLILGFTFHHKQMTCSVQISAVDTGPTRITLTQTLNDSRKFDDFIDTSIEDSTEDKVYDYLDYVETLKPPLHNQTKRPDKIVYTWAKWLKWGKCSRACDGGVQTKVRPCIERVHSDIGISVKSFYPKLDGKLGCRGIFKKHRMCNVKKCSNDIDFRDYQCSMFDNVLFKGKYYKWEGYAKDHHECELNCKPIHLGYYTTLNKTVIDGTPCTKPAVFYTHSYQRKAVCVEGICRAVHSSGAIRSSTTNDSRMRCGSVLCQTVSEIFGKSKLPFGYAYIATIGAGAMNLTVKQMAKSENVLALKSIDDRFIVNGNNRLSNSGDYEFDGDIFEYDRESEIIFAKGPLKKSVNLLLLVNGINPGIKYDYKIPVPSASISDDEEMETSWNELGAPLDDVEDNTISDGNSLPIARPNTNRKRRKFFWKLLGFGQCSRSCGAGVRSPIFRCIRDSPTRFYSPRRCAYAEKPIFHEDIYKCNLQLCPAFWQTDEYGACKCRDGDGKGLRYRRVFCVQEQASGQIEPVDATHCQEDLHPEISENCDCPKKIRRRILSPQQQQQQQQQQQRSPEKSTRIYARLMASPSQSAVQVNNLTATATKTAATTTNNIASLRGYRTDEADKTGVWLMSDWAGGCATQCDGSGQEHRSIYCDRTPPYTDLCDLRITPEMKRPCTGSRQCREGVWFASMWGNCTGDCFNLTRTRTVMCIRGDIVVSDAECKAAERPSHVTNCTHTDVTFCGPKWHYSEWSGCSRHCGDGIQRRYAKCLEYDWKLQALEESNRCKYLDREPVYGTCNLQKCEELDTPIEDLQNDLAAASNINCIDEFTNCNRINRSRMCKIPYYQTNCCLTCHGR